jgi:hypothetical protein
LEHLYSPSGHPLGPTERRLVSSIDIETPEFARRAAFRNLSREKSGHESNRMDVRSLCSGRLTHQNGRAATNRPAWTPFNGPNDSEVNKPTIGHCCIAGATCWPRAADRRTDSCRSRLRNWPLASSPSCVPMSPRARPRAPFPRATNAGLELGRHLIEHRLHDCNADPEARAP